MSETAVTWSVEDVRRRVLARGSADPEYDSGDAVLNPDLEQLLERAAAREAAVLVPIVDRPEGASVLLTTRSATLRKHSGQIAFPGGSVDPEDASVEAAALREAREEIALDSRFVETLGRLPRYRTFTGFRITPVVAIVRPGFALKPDPAEVADIFEVPLSFLMDEANHRRDSRELGGHMRHFYSISFGDRMIWGVTAGILRTLYERLYRP